MKETSDLLHRKPEKTDVGSLAEGARSVESQVVSFIVPDLAIPVPALSKDRYQGHQCPRSGLIRCAGRRLWFYQKSLSCRQAGDRNIPFCGPLIHPVLLRLIAKVGVVIQ